MSEAQPPPEESTRPASDGKLFLRVVLAVVVVLALAVAAVWFGNR